ncbi:hypothetical protein F5Y14DRAFT_430462 [Nemania sp. NC0429]|nr:hypothetical protein F5Y14DRAFT_430462 [Nemania sp. NC0429]
MAPWSSWFQSTSQQQQDGQQKPPAPAPAPTPSSSPTASGTPSSQPPVLLSNKHQRLKTKDDRYKEIPSSAELWQIAAKSLQTGMVTGGIGLLIGAGSGIMRSAPPAMFALFAGFQWFTLGSSYMASRDLLCHAWGGRENMSTTDLVTASGVAGGVSGMLGGMIRGPRNILPGVLFFGTLGAGTSYLSQLTGAESRTKTSWLDSKLSPVQRLSDKDYIDKVDQKILRLDAEIAIIDETITSLKKTAQSPTTSGESPTSHQ